jgi:CubicO group peptidase (beta-lactamase class C family)
MLTLFSQGGESMFSKDLAPRAISIVMLCALLAPVPAVANATLDIIQGSGEFQTFRKSITLGAPEAIAFRWSTDQANATGGTWKVTEAGSPQILASGESAPAPKPGHIAWFTIPAGSFLKGPAPSPGVTYSITITPHDGMNNTLGNASGAVAVIYEKQSPPPPVTFGPSANFPDIELVHYSEQIGQVPLTQLLFVNATVIVRAVNNSGTKTDPFNVAVTDFNVLMNQTEPVQKIAALNPGMPSGNITVHLTAMLPPPKSQLGQEQQIAEWKAEYKNQCGVDLRATLDWAGPQAQAPMNDHAEQYLYLGYGDSKSWDEGYAAKKEICDANECINLNDMARYVYKQLACKVVGYAFFVGDQTSGPRGVFRAYGEARTSLNGIPITFSPDTQMQIASASKVLTALAGMRVFDGHLEDFAFKSFPSNWTLPNNSIVKKIRFREFLSQTSGVQQYYPVQNPLAGPDETFAGLKTFYTQTLANPNAPFFCPGPPNPKAKPPVPLVLPNPIISNKSPCYSNANFAIMRLVMPRFAGTNSNDPATLADTYVQQVQQNVFTPVGVSNVACKPSGDYALLYVYPGNKLSGDWADTPRLACGSWGWYVSVRDYAKVLVSLNSADHKILSDCQFLDMETNPSSHPVGWDIKSDGTTGLRWLEKNGAEGTANGSTQTTSVGIYLGSPGVKKPDGKCTPVSPGVAGVLFINSDISGQPKSGASAILTNAFRVVVKPK